MLKGKFYPSSHLNKVIYLPAFFIVLMKATSPVLRKGNLLKGYCRLREQWKTEEESSNFH